MACNKTIFCEEIRFTYLGISQVGLAGIPNGLSFEDTRDLWNQADIDGNGVVDYEEFKVTDMQCLHLLLYY